MNKPKATNRKSGAAVRSSELVRRIRWINKLYAAIMGYFWSPCPICGQMFGGHECASECLYTEPLKQIGNAWLRHPDGTSEELPDMPVYSRDGKCVCWRCNDKAAALNAPNGTDQGRRPSDSQQP